MDGLAAAERLLGRPDPPKVVVLTTFHADEYVVRALAIGAVGFLLKATSPPMIVQVIERCGGRTDALAERDRAADPAGRLGIAHGRTSIGRRPQRRG